MPSTTPKVSYIQDSIAKEKNRVKKVWKKWQLGGGGGSGPLWQNHESGRIFKTMIKRIQKYPFQIIKYPRLRGQPVNQITGEYIQSKGLFLAFSLHVWYNERQAGN